MKKKIFLTAYIVLFWVICFIPGFLTPFFKDESTAENRKLSEFPDIRTENGKINTDWSKDFDTYFSEHFAFRKELVSINAKLMESVFKTSSEDDVIIGRDGWLYYGYTVNDFTGISAMEQWETEDTAHLLKMMQSYAEKQGVKMIFAAVPNKNTVYPEYMPYNYLKSDSESNLDRLEKILPEKGVDFCSLKNVLCSKKQENPEKYLYHRTDTHWNNYGALTAYQAICEKIGAEQIEMNSDGFAEKVWTGDLQKMLFPDSGKKDEQINYEIEQHYSYVGRFRGLDDLVINTVCPDKAGRLLMFRDSFGEAIIPFMAESFAAAQFSRTIPYSLNQLESGSYDFAVLEIVERNLKNLRKSAPLMPSPECDNIPEYTVSDNAFASCFSTQNGSYLKIYGEIDPSVTGNKSRRIYASVNGVTYEAFPVYEEELLGGDGDRKHGFSLNISAENADTAEIIIETDNGFVSTGKINIEHLTINS